MGHFRAWDWGFVSCDCSAHAVHKLVVVASLRRLHFAPLVGELNREEMNNLNLNRGRGERIGVFMKVAVIATPGSSGSGCTTRRSIHPDTLEMHAVMRNNKFVVA